MRELRTERQLALDWIRSWTLETCTRFASKFFVRKPIKQAEAQLRGRAWLALSMPQLSIIVIIEYLEDLSLSFGLRCILALLKGREHFQASAKCPFGAPFSAQLFPTRPSTWNIGTGQMINRNSRASRWNVKLLHEQSFCLYIYLNLSFKIGCNRKLRSIARFVCATSTNCWNIMDSFNRFAHSGYR